MSFLGKILKRKPKAPKPTANDRAEHLKLRTDMQLSAVKEAGELRDAKHKEITAGILERREGRKQHFADREAKHLERGEEAMASRKEEMEKRKVDTAQFHEQRKKEIQGKIEVSRQKAIDELNENMATLNEQHKDLKDQEKTLLKAKKMDHQAMHNVRTSIRKIENQKNNIHTHLKARTGVLTELKKVHAEAPGDTLPPEEKESSKETKKGGKKK